MNVPPPPYVMFEETNGNNFRPPPYRRNVPRYDADTYDKRSGGKSCCKYFCICYCCLFVLIVILALVVVYFFMVHKPKVPTYNVQDLQVKAFDVQPDFSLNTEFLVTVKAENPNSYIGFIYGKDSSVNVMYTDSNLCSGQLPNFEQGQKNTTLMNVDLKGKSEFGSGLQEAYTVNKDKKKIPLLVKVRVPVSVVVLSIPTRQFVVFVNCSLVVDNLAPNKKISIISSTTTFDIKF